MTSKSLDNHNENHGGMPIFLPRTVNSRRSNAFQGILQRCYSIMPDFDPVMQLMAIQVSEKIRQGSKFDKHMAFLAGAIAMLVLEEFM